MSEPGNSYAAFDKILGGRMTAALKDIQYITSHRARNPDAPQDQVLAKEEDRSDLPSASTATSPAQAQQPSPPLPPLRAAPLLRPLRPSSPTPPAAPSSLPSSAPQYPPDQMPPSPQPSKRYDSNRSGNDRSEVLYDSDDNQLQDHDSGFRSLKNEKTGEVDYVIVESPELQRVLKRLKIRVVERPEAERVERKKSRERPPVKMLKVINAPFYDLFFAHDGLKQRMRKASGRLRRQISIVINFISFKFASTFDELAHLRSSNAISFDSLWTLFPPRSIVYERRPTAERSTEYEQCSIVKDVCIVVKSDGRSGLRVMITECRFKGGDFCHVTVSRVITEFKGNRDIAIDVDSHGTGLPIVPLERLPVKEQASIRTRLVERGLSYVKLFETPMSLWQYEGPVLLTKGSYGDILSSVFSRPGPTDDDVSGNWIVNERVVLDNDIRFDDVSESESGSDSESDSESESESESWDKGDDDDDDKDDDMLVHCGHVHVYLLDTRLWTTLAIVSRLRPIEWRSDPLCSFQVSQKDMVKDLISNFSPYGRLVTSVQKAGTLPKAGLFFWAKGHVKDCREFAAAVAEVAKKPFVRIDFLDAFEREPEKTEDFDLSNMFSEIRKEVAIFVSWSPVLMLENCSAWMERRSPENVRHCHAVTQFSKFLRVYPGILFLLPGKLNVLDPVFEELSFITVEVPSSRGAVKTQLENGETVG